MTHLHVLHMLLEPLSCLYFLLMLADALIDLLDIEFRSMSRVREVMALLFLLFLLVIVFYRQRPVIEQGRPDGLASLF